MRYVDGHVEAGTQEARQGESPGRVRYVLEVGTFIAVMALIAAYFV